MTAADIFQETIIIGPFGHRQGRQSFDPTLGMRNPTPGIKCRLRCGYRFGIQNLFRIHTNPFCLLHDEMKMAVLRILVLNDFAKLVLKNFLLDRHHRAVGRNVGPAVATVADVEAELRDHQLRPALVHLD